MALPLRFAAPIAEPVLVQALAVLAERHPMLEETPLAFEDSRQSARHFTAGELAVERLEAPDNGRAWQSQRSVWQSAHSPPQRRAPFAIMS